MKPNINFLRKVERQEVRHIFGYSMKRGGYWRWAGGEATARRHADAGFVKMPSRGPSLGRPAYVTLTDAGVRALAEAAK